MKEHERNEREHTGSYQTPPFFLVLGSFNPHPRQLSLLQEAVSINKLTSVSLKHKRLGL